MSDDDVRDLLATLDAVQPAPAELVERVWRDVESFLADGEPAPSPSAVTPDGVLDLHDRAAPPAGRPRPPRTWLAVAAVIVLVALVFAALDLVRDEPEDLVAGGPTPSSSPVPPTSRPGTLDEVCAAFRTSVADLVPIDDDRALDDANAVGAWLDALAVLAEDIDRLGSPEGAGDQDPTVTLLLLRSALRNVELRLEDGDTERAATSLANAVRHRDSLRRTDTELGKCFE